MNKIINPLISLVTVLVLLLSFTGCEFGKTSSKNENTMSNSSVIDTSSKLNADNDNSNEKDSFVELKINEINVNEINVVKLKTNEIKVNPNIIKEIQSIDIETITINDSMIPIVCDNFKSIYGDDFDIKKFLTDAAIGSTIFLVYITLSTVSGPIAPFFGAVISNELTKTSIVIGAAIDAAVSGYQAYKEGGDASYIIGHMINGVAEGFKWSACLAPVSSSISGIKTIRALKELKKIPGLKNIKDKEAESIFKHLDEIIKADSKVGKEITDNIVKETYKKLPEKITNKISKDTIKSILENKSAIIELTKKYNPFNVSMKVTKSLQNKYWDNAGISEETGKEIIYNIKNKSIKSINDITEPAAKDYIEKNMYTFVEYFGGSLSDDFIKNQLKNNIGEEIYNSLSENITKKECYLNLIEKYDKSQIDEIIKSPEKMILIQQNFGVKNLNKLNNSYCLYSQLSNGVVNTENISDVIKDILSGNIKSLSDITDEKIRTNVIKSREVILKLLDNMNCLNASSDLLIDIGANNLKNKGFSDDFVSDIFNKKMNRSELIEKYGEESWQSLIKNYNEIIYDLGTQTSKNTNLITEMTEDALKSKNISETSIESILNGQNIDSWKIEKKEIYTVDGIVYDYYQNTNPVTYENFISEYAEIRGEAVDDFIKQNNSIKITNSQFAGQLLTPTGSNADYIKTKYGEIYMSKSGFPIFDKYAVARVEIDNLTGIDSIDINLANKLHHGSTEKINGYTWHHLEDGKTMILIPTDLHEAYRHTGGAALIREGFVPVA